MRLKKLNKNLCSLGLISAALSASFLPAIAQAPADVRVALVIGNAAYAGDAALVNPSNDAKAMAQTLRALGFTVVEVVNGNKAQMTAAIANTQESLKGKRAVGMLYYAGHGLQLDWRNYMVPVDAKLTRAADVATQTIDLDSVVNSFKQAGNRMNIVILDACRDNPFGSSGSGKGLAQLDAPTGTFLAYATAPGNVAEDGEVVANGQGNGLYTGFLLQELKKPQAKIEDVFKRVRFQVRQKSSGRQIPWESTSLEDDFYFDATRKPLHTLSDAEKDKQFALEKADWDKIKDSTSANDLYAFLQKFPNGFISSMAQHRLDKLQKEQTIVVADQKGLKGRSFFNSAKNGDVFRFEVKDGMSGASRGFATITMKQTGDDIFEGISNNPSVWSGTLLNSAGSLIGDGNGATFDPPMVVVPGGDLKVGNKDESRSMRWDANGNGTWLQSYSKVIGRERIKTAFGEIETFKLEWVQKQQNGTVVNNIMWYDPEWVYALRFIREIKFTDGRVNRIVREMVERRRGS